MRKTPKSKINEKTEMKWLLWIILKDSNRIISMRRWVILVANVQVPADVSAERQRNGARERRAQRLRPLPTPAWMPFAHYMMHPCEWWRSARALPARTADATWAPRTCPTAASASGCRRAHAAAPPRRVRPHSPPADPIADLQRTVKEFNQLLKTRG